MEPVGLLRIDHGLLRKKTLLLESALQIGPEARVILRELGSSLMRVLDGHIQREAPLLQRYQQRAVERDDPVHNIDHAVERHLLRAANRLLVSRMKTSLPMIILRMSQAVEQLQSQMVRQERLIFPWLEESSVEAGSIPIQPTMSVNEVLHRYPSAQPVFDALRINRLQDGPDSVDEVAWRHGMDVSEVLERLRHAVEETPSYWYGE